ncbi:MAG TPA: ribokinase [Bacteroidales bacterium]|nr:ribokinase [Bacteroidales bacterium]
MSKKIIVIGSTNVDFLIKTEKLPGFGETVTGGVFFQNYGGKGANQAVGAARAGGDVTFVTCLGEDLYAENLMENFNKDNIETSFVFKDHDEATGSALIMLDKDGNNYLSVASGANYKLTPEHIDKALNTILEAEMIVMQMEIPFETTSYVFEIAEKNNLKVLFNLAPARPFDLSVLKKTYAFVVNEVEASMVTGLKVETDDEIKTAAQELLKLGCKITIITLGARGSYVASSEFNGIVPAFKVKAVDTTAAGDVYCGSLAVALVEGKSLSDAVRFAGAASAISVTRLGAQPSAPTRKEIEEFMAVNL